MDDLKYFLRTIGGIDYEHLPILAPGKCHRRQGAGGSRHLKIAQPAL
jgi:hypothetical protein